MQGSKETLLFWEAVHSLKNRMLRYQVRFLIEPERLFRVIVQLKHLRRTITRADLVHHQYLLEEFQVDDVQYLNWLIHLDFQHLNTVLTHLQFLEYHQSTLEFEYSHQG